MNAPRVRSVISQTTKIEIDLGPLPESRHLETIWVRRKRDGGHLQVNLKDFGPPDEKTGRERRFPEKHFEEAPDYDPMFDEEQAPALAPVAPTIQVSGYTDEDLDGLSTKELKGLPEWGHVPPDARIRNIHQMRDAIRAVRKEAAPEDEAPEPRASKSRKAKGKVTREPLDPGGSSQLVGS